ncbi:MAG: helix-turn-helix domain-containing protein [Oscillospiraceae bacterium]
MNPHSQYIRPSTICAICGNSCTFLKLKHIDGICSVLGCKIDELIAVTLK